MGVLPNCGEVTSVLATPTAAARILAQKLEIPWRGKEDHGRNASLRHACIATRSIAGMANAQRGGQEAKGGLGLSTGHWVLGVRPLADFSPLN
jgi:hypothetical protein